MPSPTSVPSSSSTRGSARAAAAAAAAPDAPPGPGVDLLRGAVEPSTSSSSPDSRDRYEPPEMPPSERTSSSYLASYLSSSP